MTDDDGVQVTDEHRRLARAAVSALQGGAHGPVSQAIADAEQRGYELASLAVRRVPTVRRTVDGDAARDRLADALLSAILGNTDGGTVTDGELPAGEVARLIIENAVPVVAGIVADELNAAADDLALHATGKGYTVANLRDRADRWRPRA